MPHKKYLKPSALTRLLMILHTSGPGSWIPPPNPPVFVSIDNSSSTQAPEPSGSSDNPPIPVNGVASRFRGDSNPSGSFRSPSLTEDGALRYPDSNPPGYVRDHTTSRPEIADRYKPGVDPALDAAIDAIFFPGPTNRDTVLARGKSQPKSEALRAVTQSANTFAPNFFRAVGAAIGGNIVVSAVSAWMVLAMATYGARGDTEQQMRTALALPKDNAVAKRGFQALIDNFENYKVAEVRIANKIFINQGIRPKAEFREMTKTGFRSEVQNVNFANSNEAARTINKWCEDQTNNRIKDLFEPEDLDPTTAMILLNAVYFKGQWETRFDANATKSRPFRVNSTLTVNVPTMFNNGDYRIGFLNDLKARFVEIPYKSAGVNDALSMFIVMPVDIDGLPELERNMDQLTIERLSNGEPGETNLFLPKFKIESDLSLDDVLETMELDGIFDDNADFTGIIDSPPISVTQVVQKAFIEVSEEGTEAAVATGVDMGFRMSPSVFAVDHSFIGFIGAPRQNNSVMLFSFRYTGPAST